MKARRLIETSKFAPERLQITLKAFDEAWGEISNHFAGNEVATEHARMRLAHAVLIVASKDGNDVDRLKLEALEAMALAYQKRD